MSLPAEAKPAPRPAHPKPGPPRHIADPELRRSVLLAALEVLEYLEPTPGLVPDAAGRHCIDRAWKWYGMRLTIWDLGRIVERIETGVWTYLGERPSMRGDNCSVTRALYQGIYRNLSVRVVYERSTRTLITILPKMDTTIRAGAAAGRHGGAQLARSAAGGRSRR